MRKYRHLLILDLFFASLTTLCDIVLPTIMRTLTNSALGTTAQLTVKGLMSIAVLSCGCRGELLYAVSGTYYGCVYRDGYAQGCL